MIYALMLTISFVAIYALLGDLVGGPKSIYTTGILVSVRSDL